jgi:hypothetical protein
MSVDVDDVRHQVAGWMITQNPCGEIPLEQVPNYTFQSEDRIHRKQEMQCS